MSRLIVSLAVIVAVIAGIFLTGAFLSGRFLGQDSGTIDQLRGENQQLKRDLAKGQLEITDLRAANARLQADVVGGRTVEEERQGLQQRLIELEQREEGIVAKEQELAQREAKVRLGEQEFYDATNMTQQEIGQAKQIQSEYEAMRQARDDAQSLANRWLMFIWGISITAFVVLLAFIILAMRYWAMTAQVRTEARHREQLLNLLSDGIPTTMTTSQRVSLLSALGGTSRGELGTANKHGDNVE